MPPKLLSLKPSRDLLEPDFGGYKLSLEAIPIFKQKLTSPVDRTFPNSEQYSVMHAKLFGLHNHLVGETLNGHEAVYFIDKTRCVNKICIDANIRGYCKGTRMWQVPVDKDRVAGDYNMSLKFVTPQLAVLSDGVGTLHILKTCPDRTEDFAWNCVFSEEVLGSKKCFIIQDALCMESAHKTQELHCLLLSVSKGSGDKFMSVLNWITISEAEDKKWGQIAIRELEGKGSIHYSYLEPSCKALYVASDHGFKFTIDSEQPIEEKLVKDTKKYMWSQSELHISIHMNLPADFDDADFNLITTTTTISVKYKENEILSGVLQEAIDCEYTAWTCHHNTLEINLRKSESGLWTDVLENNEEGEYFIDPEDPKEIKKILDLHCTDIEGMPPSGPTFNSQQVEECDFEEDNIAVFERLCAKIQTVSHKFSLNSHRILLTAKMQDNLPPAVALRHDVDACLWQPEGFAESFNAKHVGTLLAFGYVQASKQERKFSVSSPDLAYAAICEAKRHLFIYRQNKPITESELRNRCTSRKVATIAQQQVVNIFDEDVLGIYAATSTLFILSENHVYALKI